MTVSPPIIVALVSLIVSMGILALFINIKRKFDRLIPGTSGQSLESILSELLDHLKTSRKNYETLQKMFHEYQDHSDIFIQHVGLVRFNPFPDTGGDQSFTLALLNGHMNGFVISSLHSRDQTRIYAKPVTHGKGEGFELSREEELAIHRASERSSKKR